MDSGNGKDEKLKLYLVELTVSVVVYARNEIEATTIAEESAEEEMMNSGADVELVREIKHESELPEYWSGSFPYRKEGNKITAEEEKTCEELLKG